MTAPRLTREEVERLLGIAVSADNPEIDEVLKALRLLTLDWLLLHDKLKEAERALQSFGHHLTYPVVAELNPRGFGWRLSEGAAEHVKEQIDKALRAIKDSTP